MDGLYLVKAAKFVTAGLCIAFGGLGPALAQGYIGGRSCESISKNPDAAGVIKNHAIFSLIVVETSTIFSFVVSMLLLFAV